MAKALRWAAWVCACVGWASACRAAGREVFVSPEGKADAPGTREAPIDLASAFTKGTHVRPGTTVWIAAGRYEVGMLTQGDGVRGTRDEPVIFRAFPGERATVVGGFVVRCDHVWIRGLEIVGPSDCGVNIRGGDGVRIINNVIHESGPAVKPAERRPCGQGIGGWDVGNDHEYYGNLIYHNGWFTLDHGIYTQNTARHNTKRIVDNIIFENAGFGIHAYGQSPTLCGFHVEGNICFATSLMPRGPGRGQCNILLGGSKPISKVTLKDNCTYHPQAASKRGVDVGYSASGSGGIVVEGNYFTCGSNALELKGVLDATVRRNVFWAPAGMMSLTYAPAADRAKVIFEDNAYVANGRFDLGKWRAATGSAKTDKLLPGRDGRPVGLHVFRRANRYDPERLHLAVYNWDHRASVPVELKGFLQPGDRYRVVNVVDYFGKPVAAGTARDSTIQLPMGGHRYEPEFGAYVVFRQRGGAEETATTKDTESTEIGREAEEEAAAFWLGSGAIPARRDVFAAVSTCGLAHRRAKATRGPRLRPEGPSRIWPGVERSETPGTAGTRGCVLVYGTSPGGAGECAGAGGAKCINQRLTGASPAVATRRGHACGVCRRGSQPFVFQS